jgi:hypothetical protein
VLLMPQRASAQVIHACVNNSNGELKIVTAGATCQRNWTPLSWNVAGPAGPPGQGGTVVVDAKGKTVGRFFPSGKFGSGPGGANIVMLQIQGIWVMLPVADLASGFASSQPGDLAFWYQSSDCTGHAGGHLCCYGALGRDRYHNPSSHCTLDLLCWGA